MNLSRLLIFYEAAESLNFSQAAARLNVTQPAVSTQIRQLEDNIGVKLFARLGKKVVLTEAGEVLRGYARKIFRLRDEAERVMTELRLVQRGTLKLGTPPTYAVHIMPPLLARFQAAFPLVNVVLQEGSSLEVTQKLASLAVEVGVVAYPGPVKKMKFTFFKREELVLIVHPAHPLAREKQTRIQRLADEPFIMREKGSGTRRVVDDLFRRYRLAPRVVFETSNAEVIKDRVVSRAGLGFLTWSTVEAEITTGRLAQVTLAEESPGLDIHIAVLTGHELSRPARAFLDLLTEI